MDDASHGRPRNRPRVAPLNVPAGSPLRDVNGESLSTLSVMGRVARLRLVESLIVVVLFLILAGDEWPVVMAAGALYAVLCAVTGATVRTVNRAIQVLVAAAVILVMGCALIVPHLFVPALAVGASTVAASAAFMTLRGHLFNTVLLGVCLVASGLRQGDLPIFVIAALVVTVSIAHGQYGIRHRLSLTESAADSLQALQTAGAITHLVDLESTRYVDSSGDIEGMVGWSVEEWTSHDHATLVHPDDLDDYWLDPDDLDVGQSIDRSCRYLTKEGRWIWVRETSRVVTVNNRKHLYGFMVDVTAQRAGLDRANHEASTDPLTGLLNRRALLNELDERAGRSGHHLVLIDLDGFKEVNDTLGHAAGDQLLATLAERLIGSVRPEDVVARLGGDEFAIVLDNAGATNRVSAMVDRIAFEVSLPVTVAEMQLTTRMSAGIVRAETDTTSSDILRHADLAMYAAKRAGKTWTIFDEELSAQFEDRVQLTSDISSAIEDGHLLLHFQPIVDIDSGQPIAYEGLARWNHPERGLLLPSDFLDLLLVAERARQFTCEMVMQAWDMGKALAAQGTTVPVAVNVPVSVLQDYEFLNWYDDFMARARPTGANGDAATHTTGVADDVRLTFEVAERELHDSSSIADAIKAFVLRGVSFAVDDFGTGHATFERLRWQHVEQLKFDTDIVQGAAASDRERSILRSMLALADELDYDVVAEGVETDEQLEVLRALGCRRVQGFLFAEALPPSDALQFATAGSRHGARSTRSASS